MNAKSLPQVDGEDLFYSCKEDLLLFSKCFPKLQDT